MDRRREDVWDRGVDLELREVLGGETAPDLVDGVRGRLEARGETGARRPWLLAAGVLLGVGAVVATGVLLDRGEADRDAVGSGEEIGLPVPDGRGTADEPGEQDPAPDDGGRLVLDNGITVLLWPVPGVDTVAVETVYEAGFVHEPAGMTQASHLLEHLMCKAGTPSWGPGESFDRLNEIGMANGETLPTWSHYDYVVPADRLELCLQVAAERLIGLGITRELVGQEAPRCYQETDFVERNPRSGMLKHAFMALNQAWRHGRGEALVRGGMEAFDLEELRAFHRAVYRPDRLRVVVMGGFEVEEAVRLVREHLGAIPAAAGRSVAPIDWSAVAARHTVRWDASVRAVCVAWPPPAGRGDRLALTLIGSRIHQALQGDTGLRRTTDMVNTSSWTWPVGELPFYVYATVADGAEPGDVEAALRRAVQETVAELRPDPRQLARQALAMHRRFRSVTPQYLDAVGRQLRASGRGEAGSEGRILGQSAIHWAVADMAVGGDVERMAAILTAMDADDLRHRLQQLLAADRARVTLVVPGS